MASGKTLKAPLATSLVLLVLFGCVSMPVLVPKSAQAPAGVDFSGQWLLRVDAKSGSADGHTPGAEARIGDLTRRSRRSRPSKRSSSVHVFLETGESLKITQTEHGFFVSLDRSVVEEFTFGENREVSVGPIKAQRVSGWEDAAYIVETLDEQGAILREEWHLDGSGDVLVRDIRIIERNEEKLALQQRFDRD